MCIQVAVIEGRGHSRQIGLFTWSLTPFPTAHFGIAPYFGEHTQDGSVVAVAPKPPMSLDRLFDINNIGAVDYMDDLRDFGARDGLMQLNVIP